MRVRLVYSKRCGACFVPHIALAQIFSRSASRAGFRLMMTQGFSPRAKLSFGPELPAGVVALNEPVDIWFDGEPQDLTARLNASLPEGFSISRVLYPPEDSPNLGKSCRHAEYLIRNIHGLELSDLAKNFYGEAVFMLERDGEWLRLILDAPSQTPIGGLIKHMIHENIIAGWHEMNIVRTAVGIYDEQEGRVLINA